MIQDIAPYQFDNSYQPVPPDADSYILWYDSQQLLLQLNDNQITLPRFSDLENPDSVQWVYLFSIDEERFYWINQRECPLEEPFQMLPIFALRAHTPRHHAYAGLVGFHLHNWYNRHRFCGRCGSALKPDEKERMMRCPDCNVMMFPQICPAVIIGLTHGDKILLSKYRGRNYKDYALLAGFAEIGETIEDTVRREVLEEVGLPIKNIRYYKSQPWPHSGSLLLGFFAELDGDDESIRLEEEELSMAIWMPREELPMEADGVSLTNEMIMWFKEHPEDF
ncbi:MAG: NAD(+) diphosphatase [Peptococcaceae bacterium]|nr:NAD(+) diphosphatase [Peptococcaceae bacterium]